MSSDDDHGKQGRYPEGWGGENTAPAPSTTSKTDESGETGGDVAAVDVDAAREQRGDVDQEDGGDELETLEFGDRPGDASEYECGECNDRLEYHQSECSCGESPMWRVAVVE